MVIEVTKEAIHHGSVILVNAEYPLVEEVKQKRLISVFRPFVHGKSEGDTDASYIKMERDAGIALQNLLKDAGIRSEITGVSGYRKKEEQERIFYDSLKENGRDFTEKYVALPGHSEHQTGLAIDLGMTGENIDFICPRLPCYGIYKKFRELAPKHGFIERYISGKETITGIGAEPWHFRYVGTVHAAYMNREKLVLEEYINWIRQYDIRFNPLCQIIDNKIIYTGFLPLEKMEEEKKKYSFELPLHGEIEISGNNVDGLLITVTETRIITRTGRKRIKEDEKIA